MVEWYKEKNFQFMLKDEMTQKDVVIWKSYEKRFMANLYINQDGSEMKFPLKEGMIFDGNKQWYNVADVLKMTMKDFKNMFPDFKMDIRYIRSISVNGVDYKYNFKYSSNKKLNDLLTTIKNLGQDVTKQIFKQSFDGQQQAANMYKMEIVQLGQPEPQQGQVPPLPPTAGGGVVPRPIKPVAQPMVKAPTGVGSHAPPPVESVPQQPVANAPSPVNPLQAQPKVPDFPLGQIEKDLIEAIVSALGTNLDEGTFLKNCVQNGISEERGKELYVKAYKR